MPEEPEKRRHRRATTSTAVRCTLIDHPLSADGGQPLVVARLKNLSGSGARLDFPGVIGPGTRLRLDFTTDAGASITLYAKVTRLDRAIVAVRQLVPHGLELIGKP